MLEFIQKCWGVMSFWRSTKVGLCLLLMCAITRLKGKPYVKIQSFLNYFHLLSPLALKLHNSIFLFYIINLLWYVYILQFQCIYSVQYIFKVFWNMYKNQDSADKSESHCMMICLFLSSCMFTCRMSIHWWLRTLKWY